jgi:hypothetical protein
MQDHATRLSIEFVMSVPMACPPPHSPPRHISTTLVFPGDQRNSQTLCGLLKVSQKWTSHLEYVRLGHNSMLANLGRMDYKLLKWHNQELPCSSQWDSQYDTTFLFLTHRKTPQTSSISMQIHHIQVPQLTPVLTTCTLVPTPLPAMASASNHAFWVRSTLA